jgi:hypothetical protein
LTWLDIEETRTKIAKKSDNGKIDVFVESSATLSQRLPRAQEAARKKIGSARDG